LSILTSIIALYVTGETLNIMTLGGLALAVGILVDDATVTIENIERHLHLGSDLHKAILEGVGEGAEQNAPLGRAVIGGLLFATVSTLLFVPVVFAGIHSRLAQRKGVPSPGAMPSA
jgi:multidrug efflux pump subunit AcrB